MGFYLPEEERIRRAKEEEQDLAHRLLWRVVRVRILAVLSGLCFILAVSVGLIGMLMKSDSAYWTIPVGFVIFAAGILFYFMSKKVGEDLDFMRESLGEYREFLSQSAKEKN